MIHYRPFVDIFQTFFKEYTQNHTNLCENLL